LNASASVISRRFAPKQSCRREALAYGVSGQAYGLLYPETPAVYPSTVDLEASVKKAEGAQTYGLLSQTP
jgi:hypothetical protein